MGVDKDDNIIICGVFTDSINFTGNKFSSIGKTTNFVAKFDSDANYIWSKVFLGKSNSTRIYSLGIKGLNYYISGYYKDSLYLGSFKLNAPTANFDAFLS
ncbi:MAG: hypothetical protein HC905_21365, partial [Bacteroidales bacterium]|nr:hypothetical protein [Bacteroidales bacterium]